MTKMITITMTDLEALKAKLTALPPKAPSAFSQKDAVQTLAAEFKTMLAQGYSIEDAYAEFMKMEGADLKPSTFRTYLNQALDQTPSKAKPRKKRTTTAKTTSAAAQDTSSTAPSEVDDVFAHGEHDTDSVTSDQIDLTVEALSAAMTLHVPSVSPEDTAHASGPAA